MKPNRLARLFIVLAAIAAILVAGGLAAKAYLEAGLKELAQESVPAVDPASVPDGVYPGYYESFPVKVRLEVEVEGGSIAAVRILEHVNGQGKPAESLAAKAVLENRIDLEAVSGATYSSKAIMLAMARALGAAVGSGKAPNPSP